MKPRSTNSTRRGRTDWLLLIVFVAPLLLALRPTSLLRDAPFYDDTYYGFSIARNIAEGNGMSVDGVHPTNGTQPLWIFMMVPVFAAAGTHTDLALRAVVVLDWAVLIGTAMCLSRVVGATNDRQVERFVAIAYAASFYTIWTHSNGLETGLTLFLYALIWLLYQRFPPDRLKRAVAFGALLGLLVIARIDAGLFALVFVLHYLVDRRAPLRSRLARSTVTGITAIVVSLPWWIYNLSFGSLIPISGKATLRWGITGLRIEEALEAISRVAVPWIYASRFEGGGYGLVSLGRIGLAAACFVLLLMWHRASRQDEVASTRRAVPLGRILLITFGLLVVWYTTSSLATWFYSRYFALGALLSVPAWALFARRLDQRTGREWAGRLVPVGGVLSAIGALAILFAGIPTNPLYTDQLTLVEEHVPSGEKVAAAQSGTLGFYREGVVNVDGKVNPEALRYQDDMVTYLERENVEWFCDWPVYVRRYLGPNPDENGWTEVARRGNVLLYTRVTEPLAIKSRATDMSHMSGAKRLEALIARRHEKNGLRPFDRRSRVVPTDPALALFDVGL